MSRAAEIQPVSHVRAWLDEPEVRPLHNSRILVVDDDATYRALLEITLRKHGFTEIRTAVDGRDALAQIAAAPPDLVLLDIVMPELDGFALCRRLRADPRFADIPILVQTMLDNADDRVKAFKCGATDLVAKPINTREMVARVSIHLERRLLIEGLTDYRSRMQDELRLARRMQHDLLPSAGRLDAIRARYGVDVAGYFEPCSEVGGDLWGIGAIDDRRFALYMIDFAGHGVGAALNTFRIQTLMSELWPLAAEPSLLLENLNQRLCETLSLGQFATIFLATFDLAYAAIEYAAAGTPSGMLLAGGDAPPAPLDGTGLPLGLMASATYPSRHAALPRGASLVLVSDGLLEAHDRGGAMLGMAAFTASASRAARAASATGVVEAVMADFNQSVCKSPEDDLTVVCIRR